MKSDTSDEMDSLFCQHRKESQPVFRLLWHHHAPLKPWQRGSTATEGHSLTKWNLNADSSVCRIELLWWSGLSYLYGFSYQSGRLRPIWSWCFLVSSRAAHPRPPFICLPWCEALNRSMETACFDPSIAAYVCVEPSGPGAGFCCRSNTWVKGLFFPLKDKPQWGSWESEGETAPVTS